MDINDLTLGQAKELAALFGAKPLSDYAIGGGRRPVIVRSRDAGVQFGLLVEYSPTGATVTLESARQMWSWTAVKGGTLLDCALRGVKAGKFSDAAPRVIVLNACAIIDCTADAAANLAGWESQKWQ